MSVQPHALVNAPLNYYPRDDGGEFKDDISEITSTLFKESGVKCGCGSKKLHRNKYSFQQQHISNKMHQKWLNSLNRNRADILKERTELKREIRDIRVREASARQTEVRLRNEMKETSKLINTQQMELMKQTSKINEQTADIEQMLECIQDFAAQRSNINKLKKTNIELTQRNETLEGEMNIMEKVALAILKKRGYEIA